MTWGFTTVHSLYIDSPKNCIVDVPSVYTLKQTRLVLTTVKSCKLTIFKFYTYRVGLCADDCQQRPKHLCISWFTEPRSEAGRLPEIKAPNWNSASLICLATWHQAVKRQESLKTTGEGPGWVELGQAGKIAVWWEFCMIVHLALDLVVTGIVKRCQK